MHRHSLHALACLSIVCLAACGSRKFSDDFTDEIKKDCFETLSCNTANNSGTDAMQQCVARTGDALDSAAVNTQQSFVDTVTRCELSSTCTYVNCTMSDPTSGYAGLHQQQIMFDCLQRAACRMANDQAVSTTVADCVSEQSAILNGSSMMAIAFDAKYMRCSSYMGCAWNTCQ